MILGILRKITCFFIALVMSIGLISVKTESHTVLDNESCKLSVAVLSDIHIEGNNLSRYNTFGKILRDVKNNAFGNDVAVFLGDNTMNGQNIESVLFYGILDKEKIADQNIIVCGNHDVGNGEGDYDELMDRFLGFNNGVLDMDIDSPYYYKVVDGYYFITLAPEALCVYEAPISEKQLQFLDETLSLATADGKPAFVCGHHPLFYFEDLSGNDISDRVVAIMNKYDNVFYLSGHTHMSCMQGWTFRENYGINEINLPRTTDLTGEDDNTPYEDTGYVVQLEVYDNEVVGRVRNAYKGVWAPEFDYHFKLK